MRISLQESANSHYRNVSRLCDESYAAAIDTPLGDPDYHRALCNADMVAMHYRSDLMFRKGPADEANQVAPVPLLRAFTHQTTEHYLHLQALIQAGVLDVDVSPSEYEGRQNAGMVALHYLAQQTDYRQFSEALKLGRAVRQAVRVTSQER